MTSQHEGVICCPHARLRAFCKSLRKQSSEKTCPFVIIDNTPAGPTQGQKVGQPPHIVQAITWILMASSEKIIEILLARELLLSLVDQTRTLDVSCNCLPGPRLYVLDIRDSMAWMTAADRQTEKYRRRQASRRLRHAG